MTAVWRYAVAAVLVVCEACGSGQSGAQAPVAPPTVSEQMLAMLPDGAQVVLELDLARLRGNPVVGSLITRALAERAAPLPAGLSAAGSSGAAPLAVADRLVLAAYGVGTADAATLTVLAARGEIAGAAKLVDGFYAIGPPEWVEQAAQRAALATVGNAALAIHAPAELLELRKHAMPDGAPGAALRLTARLPFDARIALARQTGLDAAPAQISAWADVADDLAMIVDCDASDPGDAAAQPDAPVDAQGRRRRSDAPSRMAGLLRGALAAIAEQPTIRALGLPESLSNARLIARGAWVRAIIAVGPAHLHRVVDRAVAMLPAAPVPPAAVPPAASGATISVPVAPSPAAAPPGDHP